MKKVAVPINLSGKQREILEELAKGTHVYLDVKERAQLILAADKGMNNKEISREYEYDRGSVIKWRNRWVLMEGELDQIERDKPYKLREVIKTTLSDAERSGAPPKFTSEQVAHIITLACQLPQEVDDKTPISHWTAKDLANKAIELKIVGSISSRQVSRFLKRCRYKASSDKILAQP